MVKVVHFVLGTSVSCISFVKVLEQMIKALFGVRGVNVVVAPAYGRGMQSNIIHGTKTRSTG
jgi:hypothetical protein